MASIDVEDVLSKLTEREKISLLAGATFDTALLEEAGRLMGQEALAKGAHVILGPTINMQRSPLGGRGFESIGEDPVLAGLGSAALVKGMQENGVVATIKHFVGNDQEHERNRSFMTAYNKINGTHVSENTRILKDILRGEWGWKGLVM
ncbi:unnamed protein product [Aureobasidium pullulans]|nr:unnamed protein product [Aureobasidium pullulans]